MKASKQGRKKYMEEMRSGGILIDKRGKDVRKRTREKKEEK